MNSREALAVDTLEVIQKGFLGTEHTFIASSIALGKLTLNTGRTKGLYLGSDSTILNFSKTSFWKQQYQLQQGDAALGSAASRRFLSRTLVMEFNGNSYTLVPGRKIRNWLLKDLNDQVLCEFKPRGGIKRGAYIQIYNQLTYALLIFSYCLVSKRWQEQSSTG